MKRMNAHALDRAMKFLDSWLAYYFEQTDIPGLSVAIAHKDKIVWSRACGVANTTHRTPLATDHIFCVASQSKMFTTVAILQLAEQGKLSLEDQVSAHIPWLAEHSDKRIQEITIRQILSHGAGFVRDLPDSDFWQLRKPFPDAATLRKATLATDIALEPNTKLKYSNVGYALLGQLIESVTGQSHTDYVAEHIIGKLELKATFADYTPNLDKRLVTGYGVPFGRRRLSLEKNHTTAAFASAVGIHTTAEDMCRFGYALCPGNTTLVSDTSKKEAQRSQWVMTDGYDSGLEFGLGFEVLTVNQHRLIGHSGHLAGHLTATFVDPLQKLTVAVMANCKDAPSTQIVTGIFGVLDHFGQYANELTPESTARFNARLYSPIASVEIVATADKLVAIDPNDWQPFAWCEELEQVSPDVLRITTDGSVFNEGEYIRYDFSHNSLNSVTYAGCTLLPEAAYKNLLENNYAKTKSAA